MTVHSRFVLSFFGILLLVSQCAALLHSVGHIGPGAPAGATFPSPGLAVQVDAHGHIDFRRADFSAGSAEESPGCLAYHAYLLHTPATEPGAVLPIPVLAVQGFQRDTVTTTVHNGRFDAYAIRGPPHSDVIA